MVIDLKQCASLIREHNEFVIISHEHPDGDTLGSAFALAEILKIMGKKRVVKCSDKIPKDFYYMTDSYVADDVTDPFIITVDVADQKLLGDMVFLYGGRVDLCIDHHMSNTYYAKYVFVEDRAAACGIIYELALELGIEPNLYMRECIYTGISTDTGCFRYQNTTPQTLRIAADLMEKGIDSKKINKLMFETKSKKKTVKRLVSYINKIPRLLLSMLCVNISAYLAALPLSIIFFHSVPTVISSLQMSSRNHLPSVSTIML